MRAGAGWRWWNGSSWTTFTERDSPSPASPTRKPRLPRWLSVPVAWTAPPVAVAIVVLAAFETRAVLAGLVPLLIVLPVVAWIDRVEPEPRASRAHALLWGASVAIVVALVCNTVVQVVAGETAAMVLSAPLAEEAMKALGVVWAVRRGEVDGVSDGIVYAAWVALGFAVVEDMSYFAIASVEGSLAPVFVLRALLTPFAHPLFTFWTGLAVGRAVRAGRPLLRSAWWGYAIAVACHMTWNGALSIGQINTDIDDDVAGAVILATAALFVLLFAAVAIALVKLRGSERRGFVAAVPGLVLRYHVAPDEAMVFAEWRRMRRHRRGLPRRARRDFDRVHAALARLWLLAERRGRPEPEAERVLISQLDVARADLRRHGGRRRATRRGRG
jgi:RsiW-degrading membrane proteinase PrsW (M82 family)